MSRSLHFVSAARRGLSALTGNVDPTTGRPVFRVGVDVARDGAVERVSVDFQTWGPGDVTGLDTRQIVRVEPRPGTADFEPNKLPFIEFDRPELPWMFSPEGGSNPAPWLVLLVFPDTDAVTIKPSTGPNPVLDVDLSALDPGFLPDLADRSWWAHVQLTADADTLTPEQARALLEDGPRSLSRVLCPIRLDAETNYIAALVPAYRGGVQAGLGQDVEGDRAAELAFTPNDPRITLPAYHHWRFRTSAAGDFESLVRRLTPRPVPASAGGLTVELAPSDLGLPGEVDTVLMRGALREPNAAPAEEHEVPVVYRDGLDALFDTIETVDDNDPVLGPPHYGGIQADRDVVPDDAVDWFRELNIDPRHRAAAGAGAAVVQKEQERLAAEAWRQLGPIREVNAYLSRVGLGMAASTTVHTRLVGQSDAQLLGSTTLVHDRVADPDGGSVAGTLDALPGVIARPSFRKMAERIPGAHARLLEGLAGRTLTDPVEPTAPDPAELPPIYMVSGDVWNEDPGDGPQIIPPGGSHTNNGGNGGLPNLPDIVIKTEAPWTFDWIVDVVEQVQHAPADASEEVTALQQDLATHVDLVRDVYDRPAPEPRPILDLAPLADAVRDALNPQTTFPRMVEERVTLPGDGLPDGYIGPVCVSGPDFPEPLYTLLADSDPELVLPGVGDIPVDTVTVVETNPEFIESFMVGANHELSRELTWRGVPHCRRKTFFRQFWDPRGRVPAPSHPADAEDIAPIALWANGTFLGTHAPGTASDEGVLVLLLKGALLKRYPNTVLYALPAEWTTHDGRPVRRPKAFDPSAADLGSKTPLFRGMLDPDVAFMGFDLTTETARGDVDLNGDPIVGAKNAGWFFVLSEQPSEVCFGLDASGAAHGRSLSSWDDLAWDHPTLAGQRYLTRAARPGHSGPGPDWGDTAAGMASILRAKPYRVAIHADDMIRWETP